MTHLVAGYPSFKDNETLIETMASCGVEFIEIQLPFSDSIADGPVIVNANQTSLAAGTKTADCIKFAKKVTARFPDVKFLFMTYYNIVYNYGVEAFAKMASEIGIYGIIVPDIPPEEDSESYYSTCRNNNVHPVIVISPSTSQERLEKYREKADGLIYCTSRVGLTGSEKDFSARLKKIVKSAGETLNLPVAVGFGIDSGKKAAEVSKYADIVVIGTKILKIVDENPDDFTAHVKTFLESIKKGR